MTEFLANEKSRASASGELGQELVGQENDDSTVEYALDWTWIDLIPVLIVTIAVGIAYAPEFRWLFETWTGDPNYSHGFLVIPVALWILWRRFDVDESVITRSEPAWWAWIFVVSILIARGVLHERGNRWGEATTLLFLIPFLTLTLGGWALLKRSWPAIAFLAFMYPIHSKINDTMAQPLQMLATRLSVICLKITGLWAISEGNVILVEKYPLGVAEACNGLSMLMTLAATITAMTLIFPVVPWKRVVLLLSIPPVALISNVIRIVATAWCVYLFGPEIGGKRAHDAAGWLMMPLALALSALELQILNWLVVEEEVNAGPMLLGRPILQNTPRAALGLPIQSDGSPTPPSAPNPSS